MGPVGTHSESVIGAGYFLRTQCRDDGGGSGGGFVEGCYPEAQELPTSLCSALGLAQRGLAV